MSLLVYTRADIFLYIMLRLCAVLIFLLSDIYLTLLKKKTRAMMRMFVSEENKCESIAHVVVVATLGVLILDKRLGARVSL